MSEECSSPTRVFKVSAKRWIFHNCHARSANAACRTLTFLWHVPRAVNSGRKPAHSMHCRRRSWKEHTTSSSELATMAAGLSGTGWRSVAFFSAFIMFSTRTERSVVGRVVQTSAWRSVLTDGIGARCVGHAHTLISGAGLWRYVGIPTGFSEQWRSSWTTVKKNIERETDWVRKTVWSTRLG